MDLQNFAAAGFLPAPKVRVMLNLGCLFDIPTGKYLPGKHGERILNGGLNCVTGVGGRGNTFKSVLTHFMNLRAVARYSKTALLLYDTEATVTFMRLMGLCVHLEQLAGLDLEKEGRVFISDSTVMSGNAWFQKFREMSEQKLKDSKKWMRTTPFVDETSGDIVSAFYPTLVEIDSLSMFMTDSVENIYEKHQIGDGAANTDSLRAMAAKSQMLMQIPNLTAQSGCYMSMTMHLGDQHQLDAYAPPKKQLALMKQGLAFKHVPQKTSFLMNNLWLVEGVQVFQNKATKAPEYPRNSDDDMPGDTDLQLIQMKNLRSKTGASGLPMEIVLSQSEGVLVGLSEFNFIKNQGRFGLSGNDRNYTLDLVPEISLSRTTVRGKIEEHANLRRALEIVSEMCQMQLYWDDEDGVFCTPKELYDDLKAAGYDWDVLLNTRGYWVFDCDADGELPFLSTMDLMRMRRGLYHPYWLPAKT